MIGVPGVAFLEKRSAKFDVLVRKGGLLNEIKRWANKAVAERRIDPMSGEILSARAMNITPEINLGPRSVRYFRETLPYMYDMGVGALDVTPADKLRNMRHLHKYWKYYTGTEKYGLPVFPSYAKTKEYLGRQRFLDAARRGPTTQGITSVSDSGPR